MKIKLTEIQALAGNETFACYALSPSTVTMLRTSYSILIGLHWWEGEDLNLTDEEIDDIKAIVDGMVGDIVQPILIGSMFPYAGLIVPDGTLPCNGLTFLREDFPELYAYLVDSDYIIDADSFFTPTITELGFSWCIVSARMAIAGIAPDEFTVFGYDDPDYIDALDDTTSVMLGCKMVSSADILISGIKIWRRDVDANGQTAYLYDDSGDLIGTADFPDDTLGWIVAEFDTPISYSSGVTFTAAYYAIDGHFIRSVGGCNSDIVTGDLTIINTSDAGGNCVYDYVSAGTLPASTYGGSLYWVDIVASES